MIITYAYDVEVLPNFFSVTIVNVSDYLKKFENACDISIKKGIAQIELKLKEQYNKALKFVYYVEV